jgi:hypothetical protein
LLLNIGIALAKLLEIDIVRAYRQVYSLQEIMALQLVNKGERARIWTAMARMIVGGI